MGGKALKLPCQHCFHKCGFLGVIYVNVYVCVSALLP